MGKLGGNWQTTFMAIEHDGMWEVCVNSFGKPAPIGPRLSKALPLPDYPRYASDAAGANELVTQWNSWSKNNQPKKRKRRRGRK